MSELQTRAAEKMIPAFVIYDQHQIANVYDILFILRHEVDLFEEGQGGALSLEEIAEVDLVIKKIKKNLSRNLNRNTRNQKMRDLGLVRVRGALGGVYWE
jgi:hypothetical protein